MIAKKMKTSKPSILEERKLWENGIKYVIGVDEVGRGSFAGPVVVGAVTFSKETLHKPNTRRLLADVNDSKLLKPDERMRASKLIKELALFSDAVSIPVSVINKVGIGKATEKGFRKIIGSMMKSLSHKESPYLPRQGDSLNKNVFVLIDGFYIKHIRGIGLKNQKAIIKGDKKCLSIASASIIAKVHRDKIMRQLSKNYPQYHFSKNKGYGTKEHRDNIKKYGLCKIHRKSFNLSKFI